MKMPRSTQWIIDHAAELAAEMEAYDPQPEDERDVAPLRQLRDAVAARGAAEKDVADAVIAMREARHSWAMIGSVLGTSGQSANQKYAYLFHPKDEQELAAGNAERISEWARKTASSAPAKA